MKREFKYIKFKQDVLDIIEKANEILDEYQGKGYVVTLRQLYYQFIARDLFPSSWIDTAYNLREHLDPDTKNTVKNYAKLGDIISDGRVGGLIDWDAIEDRGRQPDSHSEWDNLRGLVESALNSYRLPRWRDQKTYVELWTEKDALSGVLQPIAYEYHITLMANRGYSSMSAMYESAQRIRRACIGYTEKKLMWNRLPIIFYVGDHDPSGLDMVRDIKTKLLLFGVKEDFLLEHIALTMEQIRDFNPPPNPAKITDPRAKKYIEEFGDESWELDALSPEDLGAIVRRGIDATFDSKKVSRWKKWEEQDKKALRIVFETLSKQTKDGVGRPKDDRTPES